MMKVILGWKRTGEFGIPGFCTLHYSVHWSNCPKGFIQCFWVRWLGFNPYKNLTTSVSHSPYQDYDSMPYINSKIPELYMQLQFSRYMHAEDSTGIALWRIQTNSHFK